VIDLRALLFVVFLSTSCTGPSAPHTESAGRYCNGDGLGVNLSLTLVEDGTYVCKWTG